MHFVADEVIPFVEKDYKKKPYRMIVGHSSSADFALHVFFKKPSLFNGYLLRSPELLEDRDIKLADSSLSYLTERNNTLFIPVNPDSSPVYAIAGDRGFMNFIHF